MTPCGFDESTEALGKPPSLSEDVCDPLSIARVVWHGQPSIVSCWKLEPGDLEEIQRTGRVWLMVMGHCMTPVAVAAVKPFGEGPPCGG
jgi:hypothetical protein